MVEDLEDYKDEAYFDAASPEPRAFDATLLREPVTLLRVGRPLVLAGKDSVTDANRLMQARHRGAVLVTEDGTTSSRMLGIFTERDVLFRIVHGGRNPATLAVSDVMTPDPECLSDDQSIGEALQLMSLGGFRHVPVVDQAGRPVFMVSVKDVVEFLVSSFPNEILRAGGGKTRQREGG